MAWGRSKGAIALRVNGKGNEHSNITSTTTVYVSGAVTFDTPLGGGTLSGKPRLRMWSVSAAKLQTEYSDKRLGPSSFTEAELPNPDPDHSVGEGGSWQCYLDSDEDFEFSVDSATTEPVVRQCGVPAVRKSLFTTFDRIDTYIPTGIVRVTERREFGVWYKDPCVVTVPAVLGGGYLMLLARYRYNPAMEPTDGAKGGSSIADIVCYWSKSASFNGVYGSELKGPYLLVHSSDALHDPYQYDQGSTNTVAQFRPYLGVPAGVFVGNDLYLYYTAAPNFEVSDEFSTTYLDTDVGLRDAVADFNNGEGFVQACVVRVISGLHVAFGMVIGWADTDEPNWTVSSAIPGGPSVPIRTWVATPGARYTVESFTGQVLSGAGRAGSVTAPSPAGRELTARLADPMPFVCEEQLGLFLAVRPQFPSDLPLPRFFSDRADRMYGLWRFRAVDPRDIWNLSSGGELFVPQLGRDFVVAGQRGYPDQAGEGYVDDTNADNTLDEGDDVYDYLDPDVVWIPELERWRVYVNVNVKELVYFDATDGRMCAAAGDAWDRISPAESEE